MIRFSLPLLPALVLPTSALAADSGPTLAASFLQMLLGLGIVIGLLFAALYVLKRLSVPVGMRPGALRVRGAVSVGPRERVVLVEVGDKILVLGVAPGQVNRLHELDASGLPSAPTAPAGVDGGGRDFQSWLKQMLDKRK